ncbi:hypothetical protein J7I91_22480 [Pseudomonas sp. ISL-84]|nr:hypothetical protein [Pseudomonas sp. ISL-84]
MVKYRPKSLIYRPISAKYRPKSLIYRPTSFGSRNIHYLSVTSGGLSVRFFIYQSLFFFIRQIFGLSARFQIYRSLPNLTGFVPIQ